MGFVTIRVLKWKGISYWIRPSAPRRPSAWIFPSHAPTAPWYIACSRWHSEKKWFSDLQRRRIQGFSQTAWSLGWPGSRPWRASRCPWRSACSPCLSLGSRGRSTTGCLRTYSWPTWSPTHRDRPRWKIIVYLKLTESILILYSTSRIVCRDKILKSLSSTIKTFGQVHSLSMSSRPNPAVIYCEGCGGLALGWLLC